MLSPTSTSTPEAWRHDRGHDRATPVAGMGVLLIVRVPPQHQLFDDEEDPEPDQQRRTHPVRTGRPGRLHRLGQQRQQRRPEQRAGGEAHEVRQQPRAALCGQPQQRDGEHALAMPPTAAHRSMRKSSGTGVSFLSGDLHSS